MAARGRAAGIAVTYWKWGAMGIVVRPVETRRERKAFLTFPWRIYRDDPLWVPPILSERAKRLDPQHSPFLANGTAQAFVAWDGPQPVGTIVAAEDRRANAHKGTRESIVGYFDCIDDEAVAAALFEAAMAWARERGLTSLFGPFNLDYEDSYGVLIEGRDRPPVLLCGHTPPYYQRLFESFGFEKARGDNVAFEVDLAGVGSVENAPPKLVRAARIARERGRVTVRGARIEDWDDEIDRVLLILRKGLAVLPDSVPWSRQALEAHAQSLRRIMDPDLVLLGEVDGEPVGWFLGLPNINEALQHCNGLQHPWDYARLWWYSRRQPDCLAVKSVAVVPEYWGRGVDALMYYEMGRRALARGYRWMDLSLTAEDNPMTPRLAGRMGARVYKRYRTYRLRMR
jgi:GNAT superfamily N-acetyltransferase